MMGVIVTKKDIGTYAKRPAIYRLTDPDVEERMNDLTGITRQF
ncbi:MAG: hypothetical protein ACLUIQ_01400 [Dialister invisus]